MVVSWLVKWEPTAAKASGKATIFWNWPYLQVGTFKRYCKTYQVMDILFYIGSGSRDVRLQIIEVLEGFASEWTPDTITPSPVNSVPVPTVSTVTVASDTRVAPSTAATPQSHYLPTTITAPPSAGSGDSLPSYYPPTTCLPPSHGSDSTRPSHYPLTTTISPAPSTQSWHVSTG